MPQARRDLLIAFDGEDTDEKELLLYDPKMLRGYYLDATAALIWEASDGRTPLTEIRGRVEQRLGSPLAEEMLWLTLRELEQAQLVHWQSAHVPQVTRQTLIKAGLVSSAALLPVITLLRAPLAAQALSIGPTGATGVTGPTGATGG